MAKASANADDDLVAELSRSWVEEIASGLTRTGRRLEGGWPGTMSEARRLLSIRLAAPKMQVTRQEFECLVKTVYDEARGRWLAIASRNQPALED